MEFNDRKMKELEEAKDFYLRDTNVPHNTRRYIRLLEEEMHRRDQVRRTESGERWYYS